MQKFQVQMSHPLRERLGIKEDEKLLVRKYVHEVQEAGVIHVKEVEMVDQDGLIGEGPMKQEMKEGWRWAAGNGMCKLASSNKATTS